MAKRANGEGSVRQRADGKWEARISKRDPVSGKLKYFSYYGKTRKEAYDKLVKAQAEIQKGTFVDPDKITFGDWLTVWLNEYKKNKIRPSTWALYEMMSRVHILPFLGKIPLQRLQTSDIQRLYNAKAENGKVDGSGGLSSRAIHAIHQVVNGALAQALKENRVVRNVADAVDLPKLAYSETQILNLEQVNQLLETAKESFDYVALLLEAGTAMRRGELLGLRWADVELDTGTIHVRQSLSRVTKPDGDKKTRLVFQPPKTKKGQRIISVPVSILKELRTHKARQNQEKLALGKKYNDLGLVFAGPEGNPLDPRAFTKRYEKLLAKAGLPKVSFHSLRHSVAVALANNGISPKELQNLLGHEKFGTTMDIYGDHFVAGQRERVANTLDNLIEVK